MADHYLPLLPPTSILPIPFCWELDQLKTQLLAFHPLISKIGEANSTRYITRAKIAEW